MDILQQLWAWLADPNVAYLLLVGGILAAVAAWSIPGTGLGEGLAILMLGLALIGLLRLSISMAGLLLILLGALMLLSELYFQSGGYLGLSGAIAIGIGGMFLLPLGTGRQIAPVVLIGATITAAAASLGLAFLIRELGHRPPLQAMEHLIGAEGVAQTDLDPEGTVWVRGETWTAQAVEGRITAGERVRVLAVRGLRLQVTREEQPSSSSPAPAREASYPPSTSAGSATLGSGMALLLAVHWIGFLISGLPIGDLSPQAKSSLAIPHRLSEELAARSVVKQVVAGILVALGWMALGLLLVLLLIRPRGSQRILKAVMFGVLGFMLFFCLRLLTASLIGPIAPWILALLVGLAFGLAFWWSRRPGWLASTLMGLLICGSAAAYLGHLWTPMAAAGLLLGMMFYDALSVYVFRHMQRLAEWAIEERIPMMFLIPLGFPFSRSRGPLLLLGFGDVVLPAILTFSALRAHPTPWPAVGALLGILIGYAVMASRFLIRGESHAGLPFLAGGAFLGYGLGSALEWAFG
ncbi:MAG: presenilin family intramembrane aspartyl protease [Anaerolineae bacterium]|nr:presenilin family intramembrane aspartyl protease [Thermoflexus sp.]MDW8064778.1 presenilin family intramembrane aspartyl protease [Anaerolineae bacterium]